MASHVLYTLLIASALQLICTTDAASNCPLLGPVFPKPQNISSSPVMKTAFQNFTSFLSGRDTAAEGQQNSYSLEIFSASEAASAFTYYHTAPTLSSFNSTGVKKADGDSVYRIGSLTKLFTVYTFLVEAGDIHFNAPITDYVPELRAIADQKSGDATTKVSWDDITIGALASHMAGISSDTSVMGELTQSVSNASDLIYMGFPPLPKSEIPVCGTWPECDRAQFFTGISHFDPAFAPFSTAAYSNVAYQILSYALENITGKVYVSMLNDTVINKLGLSHTFYNAPDESLGIIPGTVKSTNWYYSLGEENPAGNMYSSSSDMAKAGKAILSYKLLSGPQTRRWMKPMELDSDINAAIGAPWGVRRVQLNQKYRIVDTYDKGGSISSWTSFLVLIPDYDVGFILLIAGNNLNAVEMQMLDAFGEIIIPALEATAKDEAGKLYAGDYFAVGVSNSTTGSNGTGTNTNVHHKIPSIWNSNVTNPIPNPLFPRSGSNNAVVDNVTSPAATSLNSSITIVTDDKPGLGITRWISNGTDMRLTVAQLMTNYSDPSWVDLSIRLYPTDIIVTSDGTRTQSFKAIFEDLNAALVDKTYSTGCASWIGPTAYVYGALALDQFIFSIDSAGTVTVQPRALRVTLQKSNSTG